MGDEHDRTVGQRQPVLGGVERHTLPKGTRRVAEVIALVEARPVPAVVAREPRRPHELGEPIDVEQHHEQRVGELVGDGSKPTMAQPADVHPRGRSLEPGARSPHHLTPSAFATRKAERTPSSWKP